MSDIAVTWAKAQTVWLRPGVKDRSAGQTLVHLASYADAEGEAWALVPMLALEMDTSERTVQRGLAALKAAGLIAPTGEQKKHNGRLVPYYQLKLDHGHANTRERLKAEREAARGDMGVTPSEGAGCHGCHPSGDMGVGSRGDTGVTQIGKRISQTELEGACARATAIDDDVEAAVSAWAAKAPERVSANLVRAAWARAVERTRVASADLRRAVLAAVARDPDFRRGKAMNLDRWLDQERFRAWLVADGGGSATAEVAAWTGPDAVRLAVIEAMGEPAVGSYLAPSAWDTEARAIRTRTRTAAEKLKQGLGSHRIAALGVRIEQGGASHVE